MTEASPEWVKCKGYRLTMSEPANTSTPRRYRFTAFSKGRSKEYVASLSNAANEELLAKVFGVLSEIYPGKELEVFADSRRVVLDIRTPPSTEAGSE